MSKSIIIQVSVGNTYGYVYRPDQSPMARVAASLFEEHCITSVRRYCEKYNYSYKMITEYPTDVDILFFNKSTKGKDYDYSQGGKNKCSTLIRYLNMHQEEYDNVIVLDNDIWIPEWAEPLPEINGHHGVADIGKNWSAPHFIKFVNGGVQMVNKQAAKSLQEFVKDKCKRKILPAVHTDQAYMNEWRSLNPTLSFMLNKKWNFMVGCYPRTEDYTKYNFIHYAGWDARSILIEDVKKGIVK